MKYRLLKPLGTNKPGDLFELVEPNGEYMGCLRELVSAKDRFDQTYPIELANDTDWFEQELEWRPRIGSPFFFISDEMGIETYAACDSLDLELITVGNCFRTEADAEACAVEMRKMLNNWREDHP